MITADVALVLLIAFVAAGITTYVAGGAREQRRRARWEAECREFGCHEPPYDWEKEGSA